MPGLFGGGGLLGLGVGSVVIAASASIATTAVFLLEHLLLRLALAAHGVTLASTHSAAARLRLGFLLLLFLFQNLSLDFLLRLDGLIIPFSFLPA